LEELRVQPESKRPALRGELGTLKAPASPEAGEGKAAIGTKKLTSFFAPVANGDSSNENDEQQDTDDNSNEDEKEATLNAAWKDSQRLTDAIALLEQQRQKATYKSLWPNMGRPSQIWTKVINFDRHYLCQKKDFDKWVA